MPSEIKKLLLLSVFMSLLLVFGKFPPGDKGLPDYGRSVTEKGAYQLG